MSIILQTNTSLASLCGILCRSLLRHRCRRNHHHLAGGHFSRCYCIYPPTAVCLKSHHAARGESVCIFCRAGFRTRECYDVRHWAGKIAAVLSRLTEALIQNGFTWISSVSLHNFQSRSGLHFTSHLFGIHFFGLFSIQFPTTGFVIMLNRSIP